MIKRIFLLFALMTSVAFAQSPRQYGWWYDTAPPAVPTSPINLTCPFQNALPQTAQLSPAHTGQYTKYSNGDTVLDFWFWRNDELSITLRTSTGWLHGDASAPPGRDMRNVLVVLRDAAGYNRGAALICADPTGWRAPKSNKEIIGSGCSVLSVGYQIDGVTTQPQLFMRTLALSDAVTPCFR